MKEVKKSTLIKNIIQDALRLRMSQRGGNLGHNEEYNYQTENYTVLIRGPNRFNKYGQASVMTLDESEDWICDIHPSGLVRGTPKQIRGN